MDLCEAVKERNASARIESISIDQNALAFLAFVGHSMIHRADDACGLRRSGQAEFNANGSPHGPKGELYCAVRCILHRQYCDTNIAEAEAYPAEAKGGSEGDRDGSLLRVQHFKVVRRSGGDQS
jgi:hypothetical protein